MRDGVVLRADIYRPVSLSRITRSCKLKENKREMCDSGDLSDDEELFPVLVLRTPYSKSETNQQTESSFFPQRGYIVVIQDTRGRFESDGVYTPFLGEVLTCC